MHHTEHSLDLINLALHRNPNQAHWCRELGVSRTTLAVAQSRGHLTPIVAADLARLLGENIERWTTIALLDSQPQTPKVKKLRAIVTSSGPQRDTYTAS